MRDAATLVASETVVTETAVTETAVTSRSVPADVLEIAFEETGPADGRPVILLHGFPYDARAFDAVVPRLAGAGCRVVVPWLRGYGATRFLAADTPRSGQQAALGHDLIALLDALGIGSAVLAGYDWGGRAACVAAALWPERVRGLVTVGGYNIQDIPHAGAPLPPQFEHALWYQYYFHGERGRAGLRKYRRELCRLLWQQWSPEWRFDDATYDRSAAAFDNPDFVDVVVHSYRHRFGLAAGDPRYEASEARLAQLPAIAVPTIALHGESDGVMPVAGSERHQRHFTGAYERRVLPGIGHNLPQEAPAAFADAVLALAGTGVGGAR
jgi:pimeloyl-ACP methyl ester carboxylesterase